MALKDFQASPVSETYLQQCLRDLELFAYKLVLIIIFLLRIQE